MPTSCQPKPLAFQVLLQHFPDVNPSFLAPCEILNLLNPWCRIRQSSWLYSPLEAYGHPSTTCPFLSRRWQRSLFLSAVSTASQECLQPINSLNTCRSCSRVKFTMSTTSLSSILPKSTYQKQVLIADGVLRGPIRRPSQSMLVNTSAPSSK